jgi:cytochrome c-type biogenesis protein CcmH/NrfF
MPADTLLIIVLTALGAAALPIYAWLRAQKRIRDLEMTLLAQATDADRYEELRALLQQVAAQTDSLADGQAQLARRLGDRVEALPPPLPEPPRPVTPH